MERECGREKQLNECVWIEWINNERRWNRKKKKQKSMNLDSDLSHIPLFAIGGIAAMPLYWIFDFVPLKKEDHVLVF